MTKDELVGNLQSDLVNEYTHLMFYLNAAGTVRGLDRAEYREFFEKQAASEMNHVRQFTDIIMGLGAEPIVRHHPVPNLFSVRDILNHAISLEGQVVHNFVERMKQADELGGVDGIHVKLFLEDQFQDSRQDIDEMRMMIDEIE